MIILIKSVTYSYIIFRQFHLEPYGSGNLDISNFVESEYKSLKSLTLMKKIVLDAEAISYIDAKLLSLGGGGGGVSGDVYSKVEIDSFLSQKLGKLENAVSSSKIMPGSLLTFSGAISASTIVTGEGSSVIDTSYSSPLPHNMYSVGSMSKVGDSLVFTKPDGSVDIVPLGNVFNSLSYDRDISSIVYTDLNGGKHLLDISNDTIIASDAEPSLGYSSIYYNTLTNNFYTSVSGSWEVLGGLHSHANKNVLDDTTASFTVALKSKLDGLSNYVHPTSSAIGTYTRVQVDSRGHVIAGSSPTTLSGFGIRDAYTKAEVTAITGDINTALKIILGE